MGYSYSNIQLKKGSLPIDPEKIAEKLAAEYRLKRTESRDDADVTVAIGPENADPWITIVSEIFDEDLEKSCSIAKALSEEYRTEAIAISCFDSDYLCLNLLDVQNNVDAWAACGCFPEGRSQRPSAGSARRSRSGTVLCRTCAYRKACSFRRNRARREHRPCVPLLLCYPPQAFRLWCSCRCRGASPP